MTDNKAQMASPAYRIASLDQDFVLGDTTRGVRFQLEYQKAEEYLRKWGVASTIVVFGSARVREGDKRGWYEAARSFARIVSEQGGALYSHSSPRRNVIATGGGPGIMEAANRGAADCGALSVGFNITLPHEQRPNTWSTPALSFRFHYFAIRKMHLAMRANALVVFPGGFGTMDELFELLTLRQTDKAPRIPIVLADRDYWTSIVDFDRLVEFGMIDRADLELFGFADDAESLWSELLARGLAPRTSIELAPEQQTP
jgi:uncharacterized protein (TIGR00730 family)